MLHRRLVYIYLLNVPSFSSRYFNKIKRTSRLWRWLALSLEILRYIKATATLYAKKTARLIHSMIIIAIGPGLCFYPDIGVPVRSSEKGPGGTLVRSLGSE